MNKIILLIALLLAISIHPTTAFAQAQKSISLSAQLEKAQKGSQDADVRAVALENIFEKYNSPLVGQGKNYVKYADKYNIDWRLLPAISGLESTFARFMMPGSHNAYGWGSGHIYFNSWEEGIEHISRKLRENYYDRGADTIYKIGPIYAEADHWPATVTKFANEINNEYVSLQSQQLDLTI